MGVWKDLYGPQSRDFIEGVKAGVRIYAVWKNGELLVGVEKVPLEKELEEIEKDLGGGMFEKEVKEKEEKEKKEKPDCYKCIHRRNLVGDVHSKCIHPSISERTFENPLNIKGNPHGIQKGWFNWPVNFDPVWLESCDGFYPKNSPPSHFTEFGEKKK